MLCRTRFVLDNSIKYNNTILSLVKFSDLMRHRDNNTKYPKDIRYE